MKRTLILFIACLAGAVSSNAQNHNFQNSVIVESNFIISLSVSYDRIVPAGDKTAIILEGEYIMGIGFGHGSHWLVPEIGLLSFGPRHFLESGVEYAFGISQGDDFNESSPGIRLAYRFQGNHGITFRATANAFFNIDPVLIPTIGIGYSF